MSTEPQSDRPSYEYLGAGLFSLNHMGLGIYIRYRTNPNEIRMVEMSSRHVLLKCPDRDIMVVGDTHFANPFPVAFDYDEFVNVSPMMPVTGANTGVTNYMMNYTQYIGKEALSPKLRQHGRLPGHNQTIYADSGGFQIQSERFDYISPNGLIDWYNDNADVGMVLDFPPKGLYWPGLIDTMGEAQAKTTEILLAKKRPDLELMNVFHGETFADVNRFREIVERDEIKRVAIGGAYHSTILSSIDHAARIMTTGRQYEQYHMLGVSNIKQLYPIIRMATKGIAPYITSDSSTPLNEALNKGYYVWPAIDAPPRYYKIGDKTNRPNSHKALACGCPVCQAVKYQDVFSVFSGNVLTFLLFYHNLFAFTNLTRTMYDIIRDASLPDLKVLLRRQLETRANGRDEVLSALDYVDDAAENGVDHAAGKLQYFLGGGSTDDDTFSDGVRTLFTTGSRNEGLDDEDADDGEPLAVISPDDPRRKRMERILRTYTHDRDADAKDTVKVKQKDRIRTEKGHSKDTASAIRVPGKKRHKSRAGEAAAKKAAA